MSETLINLGADLPSKRDQAVRRIILIPLMEFPNLHAPGQTLNYLAGIGRLLGYLAIILIGTGLLTTLIQLIAYLTRPPGIMS